MKHMLFVSAAIAVVLGGAGFPTPAFGDECDKLTFLTFSEPIGLPGVTLPSGTYRFSHPECSMAGGLLRVSSQDGSRIYGTFLTIPHDRTMPTSDPQVIFAERPARSAAAIRAWFYSGERTGDELLYPRTTTSSAVGKNGNAAAEHRVA